MQIIASPKEMQKQAAAWRAQGLRIALVPTMGALHAGHEKLIAHGRGLADKLVASVFVNPAQFGPNEDFSSYPRRLREDAEKAEAMGADMVFAPTPDDMYPAGHATWVDSPELSTGLCGASRPGHFRGVCTVVLKLFMIIMPHAAVFGRKDWQQLAIIRRMAADFNLDIAIEGHPIVREADGLALSSRNAYLNPEERAVAPHIHAGLALAREAAQKGERDASRIISDVSAYFTRHMPGCDIDYISIVHPENLKPLQNLDGAALMACAVRLGKPRLIDNILLLDQ